MKKKSAMPLWLIGATIAILGAAVYLYLDNVLEEEDIDLDLSEEDESVYL